MGSNRLIELHDSEIASIEFDGGTITITFSHAYLHQSDGVPGVDRGTGWSQRGELRISTSSRPNLPRPLPYQIDNGVLTLGGAEHCNEIPVPLSYEGAVALNLFVGDAEYRYSEISFTGSGVELVMVGQPRYVEDFPGARRDSTDQEGT